MHRMIRLGSLVVFLMSPALCFAFTGAARSDIEPFPKRNAPTLPFVANAGQADGRVAFHASIGKGTVFITRDGGIVYSLRMPAGEGGGSTRRIAFHETVVGGLGGTPVGEKPVPAKVSYFRGNDPSKWRSGIPAFGAVRLGEVYDGIGVELIATGRNVEKVFHVRPGGDPVGIRLRFAGAGAINVDGAGELVLSTEAGPVRFTKPVAWQERDGRKVGVPVAYRILSAEAREYGFEVAAYDRSKELVIDPLLASTYLGGSISDFANGVAVDPDGFVYVAGTTESPDFPITPGAVDNAFVAGRPDYNTEIFVSKFDRNLSTLLASTFLGGSSTDYGYAVALDNSGNVVVAGSTDSEDFPATPGAYDNTYPGTRSAVVARLSGDLITLLASTFLGGATGAQEAKALVVAPDGAVFVAGLTSALDFPVTPGALDNALVFTSSGYRFDGFVSKFSGNLSALLASTYLGGSQFDQVFSIALGPGGNVYVAGYTESPDFPTTPGAYDNTFNGVGSHGSPFVAKLNGTLTRIPASTFLGSTYYSYIDESIAVKQGFPVTVAGDGSVYVAGATVYPEDFPTTPGAFDNAILTTSSYDGFVARFDGDLTTLRASTFLRGGGGNDRPAAIAVDPGGNVYVAGWTTSSNFPSTPGAFDNTGPSFLNSDGFVSRFDATLSHLLASTFLGGGAEDYIMPNALALDGDGYVYVAGATFSADFPVTPNVHDDTLSEPFWADAFVSRFSPTLSAFDPVISVTDPVPPIRDRKVPLGNVTVGMAAGGPVTVENIGNVDLRIGTIGSGNPLAAPFAIAGDNCSGRTVAPGDNCTFSVRFSPVAQGDFVDTFDIPSNDPGTPLVTVTVSGTGVVPDISVADSIAPANDNEVRFGNVVRHKTSEQTVTATNIGRANLLIGPVGVADPLAAPFGIASDTCSGRTLAPGAICSLAVRFSPVATGLFSDRFDIPSNDPDTPTVPIGLSGAGRVFPDPVPTSSRVLLTGVPTVRGAALSENDEVAAWSVHPDPSRTNRWEKVVIAHGVAGPGGALDPVPVYGDDPSTPGVVEGAVPGEEIGMALWRNSEGKVYWAYLRPDGTLGAWTWTSDGDVLRTAPDFVEGARIPLRNDAWNLFSYGVLQGWHKGASPPGTPQLGNVAWEPVANLGEAFPLKSIDGRYHRVIGSDAAGAKFWNPSLPSISTLSYLAPGYGYWIKMKPSPTGQPLSWMTVPGEPAAGSESLALGAGWALTGYWGNERMYSDNAYDASGELLPLSASEAVPLTSIGELWASVWGNYVRVSSFDGQGAHIWNPSLSGFSTLKYMGPGYGYWIKMNTSGTLTCPPGTR